MRNTRVRAIADAAVSAALCALLIIISVYVPLLSLLAAASGIPLMYVSCKWGAGFGLATACCAAGAVLALSGDMMSTLLIMLTYGLPSIAFGVTAKLNFRFFNAVFITAVFVIIGLIGQAMLINGGGDGIRNILSQVTAETEKTFSSILAQSGKESSPEIMAELSGMMVQVTEMFIIYFPTFIIICATVYAYGLCMLGVFFMKRLRIRDIQYTKFSMMHTPKTLCLGTVLMLIIGLADNGGVFGAMIGNASAISVAAVAVCGLSYIDYRLSRSVASGYLRALIYAAIGFMGFIFISFIFTLLTAIGVADAVFDFRRRRRIGGGDIEER